MNIRIQFKRQTVKALQSRLQKACKHSDLPLVRGTQGGMWLATCTDELLYIPDPINGSKESWQEYHSDIGFPSDETRDLYLQQDNMLWVGMKRGLARCRIETR